MQMPRFFSVLQLWPIGSVILLVDDQTIQQGLHDRIYECCLEQDSAIDILIQSQYNNYNLNLLLKTTN